MDDYIEIKKSLVKILKSVVDQSVMFEEIAQTDTTENDIGDDYWFVDMLPVNVQSINQEMSILEYFIHITCSKDQASNQDYMMINIELDRKIRPYFSFADRHITVDDATMTVVDHLAHYDFKLSYIPNVPEEIGTLVEYMEVNYKKEG